jgi:hypothetical protein
VLPPRQTLCAPDAPPRPCPPRRAICDVRPSIVRVASSGFDPVLCGVEGSAFGSMPSAGLTNVGLRVPPAPAQTANPDLGLPGVQDYLFQAATLKLPPGLCAKIVGIGQLLTIGLLNTAVAPVYPLVLPVRTPTWRFADGMVTWALTMVRQWPAIPPGLQNVLTTDSFVQTWSDSPALVYKTATFPAANLDWRGHPDNYLALTGYIPPYGGAIPGEPLGNLGEWQSVDYPWDGPYAQAKAFNPIEVEGPGAIVLWIRVRQTNATLRTKITLPGGPLVLPPTMPEEAFLAAFPTAQYWSVGGWLEVER